MIVSKTADLRNELAYNYDLIFVDFSYGAGDIRTNATTVTNLIDLINENYVESGTPNTLIGFSMGGVVARLALSIAENGSFYGHSINPTNTALFISYDSPQKGANVPYAIQHDLKDYEEDDSYDWLINMLSDELEMKEAQLKKPASKQMIMRKLMI